MTLRELVYDLLDDGRHAGDFPLERQAIDKIAADMIDTLNDRDDVRGPFDHDEMADMVDDWFDSRRIDEDEGQKRHMKVTVERRENLVGRLQNWKFNQAKHYTRGLPAHLGIMVNAMATLWGDTGWGRGGELAILVEYLVQKLVADIQALPADVPPETDR